MGQSLDHQAFCCVCPQRFALVIIDVYPRNKRPSEVEHWDSLKLKAGLTLFGNFFFKDLEQLLYVIVTGEYYVFVFILRMVFH